ncbi:KR domain-containing protein [Chryseobacterium sp. RG1]|uniref:KR domain-containing protein n=1 Tax=Chryseobacterium tagetis TaxID=2801334 RepID=A0ABS8A2S7_9FLAO|nr:NAD(P)H-binding protein [Chryseobacterium tagetis]MCA6067742.1 KR domain-containing protein [Chryseobacterium tagetis]
MKILILGAAGQIGRMLTKDLLEQTDNELVLFARNASQRLNINLIKLLW